MDAFYNIAGLCVKMDTFGRTLEQAEPYRAEPGGAEPQIILRGDGAALHRKQPHLSEDECEYLSTGDSFYRQLLAFDGMLLHASAVMMDGYAYLFSAPCGTGKSTHTALWQRVFGSERAVILNDDKPALRWDGHRFLAFGTPWSGKSAQNENCCVPVAGICMLSRGETNTISPFGGVNAIRALLEQTVRPRDPGAISALLDLIDKLMTHVPMWKMECNMDPEAARVSHAAMSATIVF